MNSFNAIVRLKRSLRAISPVLSVLMMIAIAVAASLVAYAWIMGYIGGTTAKAGQAIQVQSIAADSSSKLIVYVQNVGQGPVTINGVYVNDAMRAFEADVADNKVEEGKTATLLVDYTVAAGEMVTVKVVTSEGTFTELKTIYKGQSTSGSLNQAPTAAFTWTVNELTVNFDASSSTDSDGTIVSYAWNFGDSSVGTGVTPSHSYATAGTYTVRLTVTDNGGKTDYVEHDVTVAVPPVLDHFEFSIISSQTAGVSFGITITAKDQYGATFSYNGPGTLSDLTGTIQPTSITFTNGVANPSVTITAVFTDNKITVQAGGKSGESDTFDVSPGTVTSLDVTPESVTVTAGGSQAFTATAYDAYGNSWDVSGSATWEIVEAGHDGSWSGNVYTAAKAGTWTVRATYSGQYDTATLTVEHASAASLVVTPDSATITAGQSQTYTATATDAYGNSWDVSTSASWSIVEAGHGGSWSGNVYTSANSGTWTVRGEYSGVSDTATLTVNPVTPVTITRSPSSYSSNNGWSNPQNAYNDEINSAISDQNNENVIFSGYGFTIPAGATITQVRVRLDAWDQYNDDIRLEVYDGSWHTYTTQSPIPLSTSQTTIWCDVTGLSSGGWSPSEVNNIQVRVTHVRDGQLDDNVYLDWIPIEVTYTP